MTLLIRKQFYRKTYREIQIVSTHREKKRPVLRNEEPCRKLEPAVRRGMDPGLPMKNPAASSGVWTPAFHQQN
jgi:hypothetical protein